jgi:hypothetical protein
VNGAQVKFFRSLQPSGLPLVLIPATMLNWFWHNGAQWKRRNKFCIAVFYHQQTFHAVARRHKLTWYEITRSKFIVFTQRDQSIDHELVWESLELLNSSSLIFFISLFTLLTPQNYTLDRHWRNVTNLKTFICIARCPCRHEIQKNVLWLCLF